MSPKTVSSMVRRLKAEQAKIAKARDALRELINEYEQVAEDTTDALESIEYAIDALSRLQ